MEKVSDIAGERGVSGYMYIDYKIYTRQVLKYFPKSNIGRQNENYEQFYFSI